MPTPGYLAKIAPRAQGGDNKYVLPPVTWDSSEPRSILNLLTDRLKESVELARAERPDIFDLDEKELRTLLTDEKVKITPTINRLRMMFWNEYDRAQHIGSRMVAERIFHGACSKEYFYQRMRNPQILAWIVNKPASYEARMEEALCFGLEQMRDILELDHFETDLKGRKKLNTKLLDIKLKIITNLDVRVKGATVQRVEQKTQTVQANVTGKELKELQGVDMNEIDQRIAHLEKKALGPGAEVEDVQVIEMKEVSDGKPEEPSSEGGGEG